MFATAAAEARSFPSTPAAVAEMDPWIQSVGKRWGIDERTLFRARVCVAELAANVVEHGRINPETDRIVVELRNRLPDLEIEISDPGSPFDPATAPPLEADPDRIGGRGLRLVRSYAHVLTYCRSSTRNVVTLRLAAAG